MKIDSIGVRIPTRKITNDEILQLLAHYSPDTSTLLVKTYQRVVFGRHDAGVIRAIGKYDDDFAASVLRCVLKGDLPAGRWSGGDRDHA